MQSDDQFVSTLGRWIEVFMRRSMHNFISYSKEKGLSMSQVGTLLRLFRGGSSSVSNIGDDLGVSNAAASQMIERLVQQGLILRTEDPDDRRVKQVVLTDKGRLVLHESIAARQGWLETLGRSLSNNEREQIIAALDIMIERANQLESHPTPVR